LIPIRILSSESDSEILISNSEVKYPVFSNFKKSVKTLTQEKKISIEKGTTGGHASKSTIQLRNISREEKKKEANKPLYLFRYE
jgi:hypothetical protein